MWQDPVFFGHDELGPDELRRCLDQIRDLGVEYVDFTGGEPGLHPHLAVAVRHARQIGLHVEVTTNAIRFAGQADDVVPYVDTLNISLDTLSAERYHAIRGVDTVGRTIALVERLRGRDAPDIKLIAVVTRQTITGLDDLVSFAQANRIPVYLSPMFEYFDGQAEYRNPARTIQALRILNAQGMPSRHTRQQPAEPSPRHRAGELTRLLAAIRARAHTRYTVVNLDFLHHVETLDPSTPTACGAGSRILTIGPDGRLLLPCYHEWASSLRWDRRYLELVKNREFIRVRDSEVGELPGCRRCAVFPYIGLASSYRLTAEFLLQAFTTEINKLKACVNGLSGTWPNENGLRSLTERLLARLSHLPLRPGTHPDELYFFSAVAGRGAVSDLAAGPVAVEEILADHAHEDCWRVQRTPHRIARQLYVSVVPALVRLAGDGHSEAQELALGSLRAHLRLWEAWLELFQPGSSASPSRRGRSELTGWCIRVGDVLAARGLTNAVQSVSAVALLTDVPPERLITWGGVAGHADELFFAKVVVSDHSADRRVALAPCFSSPLSSLLASKEWPARRSEPATCGGDADLARAASGDQVELARLCELGRRLCWTGNTMAFRRLVRAWKVVRGTESAQLERILLAAELRAPVGGPGEAR